MNYNCDIDVLHIDTTNIIIFGGTLFTKRIVLFLLQNCMIALHICVRMGVGLASYILSRDQVNFLFFLLQNWMIAFMGRAIQRW